MVFVVLPELSGLDPQRGGIADTDAELPIIFLTGHGDIPRLMQAMKAGAVEVLTKPFPLAGPARFHSQRDRSRTDDPGGAPGARRASSAVRRPHPA